MPAALKNVVETDYPGSMTLRWRWRGLGDVVHTRYLDAMGNRVSVQASVALTVPAELSLEFVSPGGDLLWSAPAAAVAGRSADLRGAARRCDEMFASVTWQPRDLTPPGLPSATDRKRIAPEALAPFRLSRAAPKSAQFTWKHAAPIVAGSYSAHIDAGDKLP
jgi:hypothetical protein